MKSLDQEEWTLPERSMFTLDGAALPDALVLDLHDMNNITNHRWQGSAVFMRTLRHHLCVESEADSPSTSDPVGLRVGLGAYLAEAS